jgi:hypothetical protein
MVCGYNCVGEIMQKRKVKSIGFNELNWFEKQAVKESYYLGHVYGTLSTQEKWFYQVHLYNPVFIFIILIGLLSLTLRVKRSKK